MPMLEVPGAFTMLVADGWSATQSDGTYELTRPDDDGAAHVSTYDRRAAPLGDDEAGQVIAEFTKSTGASEPGEIVVLRESKTQHRAVSRFVVDGEGGPVEWLLFAILWPERLILCSCNGQPGSPLLDDAEQMFATIFPPKKGLFRRR
jgi:hypothetical protein